MSPAQRGTRMACDTVARSNGPAQEAVPGPVGRSCCCRICTGHLGHQIHSPGARPDLPSPPITSPHLEARPNYPNPPKGFSGFLWPSATLKWPIPALGNGNGLDESLQLGPSTAHSVSLGYNSAGDPEHTLEVSPAARWLHSMHWVGS